MALFGKDDRVQRPDEEVSFTVGSGATRGVGKSHEPEAVQAHLGKGSRVEGKLSFEGSVRIDGHVEGQIEAQEGMIVGETAIINAQISAGTVVIKGKVTGDVTARKRVELQGPAKLLGNIVTPSLVIHEGVLFEGHCSMGNTAEGKTDKPDRKVTQFPKEERSGPGSVHVPSEAIK
jgi:cytoskeletal protein CcmA (bactofilin family)